MESDLVQSITGLGIGTSTVGTGFDLAHATAVLGKEAEAFGKSAKVFGRVVGIGGASIVWAIVDYNNEDSQIWDAFDFFDPLDGMNESN